MKEMYMYMFCMHTTFYCKGRPTLWEYNTPTWPQLSNLPGYKHAHMNDNPSQIDSFTSYNPVQKNYWSLYLTENPFIP